MPAVPPRPRLDAGGRTDAVPNPSQASTQARVRAFDWLRGLAVLVMVETHAMVLLRKELLATRAAGVLDYVNGLVAPSFIFAAGFSLALVQVRSRLGRRAARPPGAPDAPAHRRGARGRHAHQLGLVPDLRRARSGSCGSTSSSASGSPSWSRSR